MALILVCLALLPKKAHAAVPGLCLTFDPPNGSHIVCLALFQKHMLQCLVFTWPLTPNGPHIYCMVSSVIWWKPCIIVVLYIFYIRTHVPCCIVTYTYIHTCILYIIYSFHNKLKKCKNKRWKVQNKMAIRMGGNLETYTSHRSRFHQLCTNSNDIHVHVYRSLNSLPS